MTSSYPISLLVDDWPCLVVGGGRVAERKVSSLLDAGASVRVVSLEVTDSLRGLADRGAIELFVREPAADDLDWARLVIIATDDSDLNARLAAECHARGLLVNVVDAPPLCNFYAPATVTRGPVLITISTGGASPGLARRLREMVEGLVGEEYGHLAELMGELRDEAMACLPGQADRAAAWLALLDSEVLGLLGEGKMDQARRQARKVLGLAD